MMATRKTRCTVGRMWTDTASLTFGFALFHCLVAGSARWMAPEPPFILELNKWKVWIADRGFTDRNSARQKQDMRTDIYFTAQSKKSKARCRAFNGLYGAVNITCTTDNKYAQDTTAVWDYLRLSRDESQQGNEEKTVFGITYQEKLTLEAYDGAGEFLPPIFAHRSDGVLYMCPPPSSKDRRELCLRNLHVQEHGGNCFDEESGILHIQLQYITSVTIQTIQTLRVGLVYESKEEEEIDKLWIKKLVSFLSKKLKLPRNAIRSLSSCSRKALSINQTHGELQLEFAWFLSEEDTTSFQQGCTYNGLIDVLTKSAFPLDVKQVHVYTKNHIGDDVPIVKMAMEEGNAKKNARSISKQHHQDEYDIVIRGLNGSYVARSAATFKIRVLEEHGDVVSSLGKDYACNVAITAGPRKGRLLGTTSVQLSKGEAKFNISFSRMGKYKIKFTIQSDGTGWVVDPNIRLVSVTGRRLRLEPMNTVPYYAVVYEQFVPSFGVKFYDEVTGEPAEVDDINFPWKVQPYFVYKGVYRRGASVSMRKFQDTIIPTRYDWLLPALRITTPGCYFVIGLTLSNAVYGKLSVTLPPVDVRAISRIDAVKVQEDSKVVLYSLLEIFADKNISKEEALIHIVNWVHETTQASIVNSSASYVGNNRVQVLLTMHNAKFRFSEWHNNPEAMEAMQKRSSLNSYVRYRVKRSIVGSNESVVLKQSLESEEAEKHEVEKEGGLPDSWIAAIVINAILVVLFILFVIYCYFRSRKRNSLPPPTMIKKGDSEAEALYAHKTSQHVTDTEREVIIARDERPQETSLFTVEDESRRFGLQGETDYLDGYSSQLSSRVEQPREIGPSPSDGRLSDVPVAIEGVEDDFEPELRDLDVDDSEEDEEPSEALPHVSPDDQPRGSAKVPEDVFSVASQKTLQGSLEGASTTVIPGAVDENEDDQEEQYAKYLVYIMNSDHGARDCIGSVLLPAATPMTLSQLRAFLMNSDDPSIQEVAMQKYNFITETNNEITFQEGGSFVTKVYPAKSIILKLKEKTKRGALSQSSSTSPPETISPRREQTPLITSDGSDSTFRTSTRDVANGTVRKPKFIPKSKYVGPLGVCYRPECDLPGRVKCVDCGMVAYCSSRCLKTDTERHRMSCYRPPWRM
ncbi:uncharacterized protein LOC135377538 isoform X2 [Ornithodoros turicata]|uniref:uncharacterized protein LOC135377538 isoform X2 n=1 Tax=Ornithodoros turicata TaxID=34597 RepID=UPI00313971D7